MKDDADQAVADAKAVVEALPDTATEEEKAAADSDLTSAEAAAVTAGAAKTAADAEAEKAQDAYNDARLLAVQNWDRAKRDLAAALSAKTAADEALAKAKEEEEAEGGECVPEDEPRLTAVATGLPSTIVAGKTAAFSLRVTNGTDKAMDDVKAFASVHATDASGLKDIDKLVALQWSTNSSPKWQQVEREEFVDAIGPLKAGAHADIKLRLSVDASAPAGNGFAFVAGEYFNEDGDHCGGSPDLEMYEFEIKAAGSEPGKIKDATPVKTDRDTSGKRAQGNASKLPVNKTTGALAETGTSSATSQMAIAGAAAVAIGAGAVFIVRRRKTGSNA
ncbi:LAETG motif-containing sortase-dependent surface protein [Streptomyces sp. M10(2022)]